MTVNRRGFLRASGVSLALPWLDALAPTRGAFGADVQRPRRRMVCMNSPLGLHPPNFFPEKGR